MSRKLKPLQEQVLREVALAGWATVDGTALACARGLQRRRIPLVEVRVDSERLIAELDRQYIACLTDDGASLVRERFGWALVQDRDRSWVVDRNASDHTGVQESFTLGAEPSKRKR